MTFGPLDEAGRRHLAARVLDGLDAAEQERLVAEGAGDTGAQFVDRCAAFALAVSWGGSGCRGGGMVSAMTTTTVRSAMVRSVALRLAVVRLAMLGSVVVRPPVPRSPGHRTQGAPSRVLRRAATRGARRRGSPGISSRSSGGGRPP